MKHNFFFKLLITIVFSSMALMGYAATPVYLSIASNNGNNSNDRLNTITSKLTF